MIARKALVQSYARPFDSHFLTCTPTKKVRANVVRGFPRTLSYGKSWQAMSIGINWITSCSFATVLFIISFWSSKFCAIITANNAITQLLNPQQYHFLHVNEIHRTSLVCPRYTSWSATSHRRVESVLKTTCIIYNIDRHASKSFLQLPVSASDNSRNPESRVRGPESRHIAEELAKSLVLSPIHPLCPYSKQIFLR